MLQSANETTSSAPSWATTLRCWNVTYLPGKLLRHLNTFQFGLGGGKPTEIKTYYLTN